MRPNRHIVEQQNIEIQFENLSDGIGIQNEIAEVFYEQLFPKMEVLFDELAPEKYSITIDRLELDCGTLSQQRWKEDLVRETLDHLRAELIAAHKKEINTVGAADQKIIDGSIIDSLLFFLEKGYLPWNSRVEAFSEFEALFVPGKSNEFIILKRLKELFASKPDTVDRFVNSFPEKVIIEIIRLLDDKKIETGKLFISEKEITEIQKRQGYAFILKAFARNDYGSIVLPVVPGNEQLTYEKQGAVKQEIRVKVPDDKEFIYIRNAGLVILHPFLPELFARVGLLVDKKWKDIVSQHEATCILEYLSTGHEEFVEFDFPLNKILCGMHPEEVLQPVNEIPPFVKEECNELLKDVIGHWSVLKNTSIDGLRETFLQRNGKLSKTENGWLLNVEQKGVDVLLSSLPWGIGTIKLPWTDEKIYVEWATG